VTNCGADTPMKESVIAVLSALLPRRRAANRPAGKPISNSKAMAATISTSVAGSRAMICSPTCVLRL
jgi:hypothetical protein